MATIGDTYLNLADSIKTKGPDGQSAATIIELLSETNEIMADAVTVEANDGTTHLTTTRTGLPESTWRKLYQGVKQSKSTTQQVRDTIGMLEQFSSHDRDLVDKQKNPQRFRLIQSTAHLESMSQDLATAFIYGDTAVNPERFMGLAPRYAAHQSTDDTKSSYNVIHAGGSGSDNTSIWFVKWSEMTCHFIYPTNSMAGVMHEDLGLETVNDGDGNPYRAYRDHYKHDVGLAVPDWRAVARVANIDVSDMAAGNVAIDDFMIDAWYRIRKRPGRAAIYCNEHVMTALHKKAKDKANVNLTLSEFEGRPVVNFLGAPIREVEAILNTEAVVPAA